MERMGRGKRERIAVLLGPGILNRASGALLVALSSAVTLVGCNAPAAPAPEPSASSAVEQFEGTPEEYDALLRACLEDHGIETSDDPASGNGTGFAFVPNGDPEQTRATIDDCQAQIGAQPFADLSEDELQRRYDARTDQWACLVDLGYATGEPISFERFVDEWRRTGEQFMWEPTFDAAAPPPGEGPPVSLSDVCPRPADVW